MKKAISALIVLLLVLSLAACDKTATPAEPDETVQPVDTVMPESQTMTVKLTAVINGSLLLAGEGTDLFLQPIPEDVAGVDGKVMSGTDLKAGMTLNIEWGGDIMESYPMQLGDGANYTVAAEGYDTVGFYKEILDYIYTEDPGLNGNIDVLAFDFSEMNNLSEAEKAALIYLVGGEIGIETITGTFDELCEQGYINKEELYFENGLLFELSDTAIEDDSFTFSVSKWRGGLGAIGMSDCQAEYKDGKWTYETNSMWIS